MTRVATLRTLKRRSKYGAVRVAGYDSRLEAQRAADLRMLEKLGSISELREHPPLVVSPDGCERITYKVDFAYFDIRCCQQVYEDTKAKVTMTDVWRIKWKLAKWKFPGCIFRTVMRGRHGFEVRDERS